MSEITMEALMRAKEKEMEETLPAQEPAEEALTPQERQRVDEIKKEIDFLDPQTDVQYGVGAQRNIADFSQRILGQVRTKDSGTAGELLLTQIQGGPRGRAVYLPHTLIERDSTARCAVGS